MAKTLQLRRGTTAEITANTPAAGELFVDTQKKTVTVGDGSTAGGIVLARNDRVSDVYNTANGANGLAAGAYNTANGANGLAAGAFNAANNKQDLLVSGTNIKTINGSSVLGSGNLVVSGGGGSAANTVAVAPTSDNFITLGTPTAVEYVPSSNITFSGSLILDANNLTSSYQANSNNYIDVVGYSINPGTSFESFGLSGVRTQLMALIFNRRNQSSLPARWVQELDNLVAGDRITIKFIAGANNSIMDTFTIPLTVSAAPSAFGGQAATDWTRFNLSNFGGSSAFTPANNLDRADNGGTGYSVSIASSTKTAEGKTIFFKNEIVQPMYTSNTTLTTTQLVGEITGRPIHHNFLTNISGKGYLNPSAIFLNTTNATAANQKIGAYQILIEKPAGTVVTLSSSDYNEILIANSSVAVANTVSSIKEKVRVYDSANSKVWIGDANLTSIVTTTTPLQVYNPPTTSALVDVGPTLKMYGDTLNNRLVSTGKLAKVENYKNLGVVASQSTTANVVIYPTVVSTKYLDAANTGTYTPVRATNGVLLDTITSSSAQPIKLINLTPEVYDLVKQNNSFFYIHYSTVGVNAGSAANLACRTVNQGNTGLYISSSSGVGTGWTEGNWIASNIMTVWQGGTFYNSNTTYSRPTWQYEIENKDQRLVIPTNVVTLTTTSDVINELIKINNFSSGPRISPLGSANNLPQIYVDGVLTQVNGIDAANNRIITNLSAIKYGNTDFTGAIISTAESLVDYATINDVSAGVPSWVSTVSSSSLQSSTSYVGGGSGGINLRAFDINTIIGATTQKESQYSMGFSSVQGAANFGQGVDRNIGYNAQLATPGGDKFNNDNSTLTTFNLGVVGGINSNYMYANNIMGTSGTSYANTHTANTLYSSQKIRVAAGNVYNEDPKIANVAVLITANNLTIQNDSPNVTGANTGFNTTSGFVVGNQTLVPPGAPAHARSFRLGGDPFTGSASAGGFYITNQNWDLANTSNSWTVESWICSSNLYQSIPLITALNTGDLTVEGTTYIRGEFPLYTNVKINDSPILSPNVSDALRGSLARNSQMTYNTTDTSGYNQYFPLAGKWYHLAAVYDPAPGGTPTLAWYVNGFIAGRTNSPTWTAGSLLYNWGVYTGSTAWFYNYRVTYGRGSDAVRYQIPVGYDGSTSIKAFTPDLEPYGTSSGRTISSSTNYRYDALDLSGGIRMDNTANTYFSSPSGGPPPPTNPIGGYLFVENGALKYRGSSGTITTVANA